MEHFAQWWNLVQYIISFLTWPFPVLVCVMSKGPGSCSPSFNVTVLSTFPTAAQWKLPPGASLLQWPHLKCNLRCQSQSYLARGGLKEMFSGKISVVTSLDCRQIVVNSKWLVHRVTGKEMNFIFSPGMILNSWLDSKHQLTDFRPCRSHNNHFAVCVVVVVNITKKTTPKSKKKSSVSEVSVPSNYHRLFFQRQDSFICISAPNFHR